MESKCWLSIFIELSLWRPTELDPGPVNELKLWNSSLSPFDTFSGGCGIGSLDCSGAEIESMCCVGVWSETLTGGGAGVGSMSLVPHA